MSRGYTLGIADHQRVSDGAHADGCRGKIGHPSKKHARGVLATLRWQQRADRHLDVYHCGGCRRWHIGHRRAPRPGLVWVPDATKLEVQLALALRPYLEREEG